VRPLTDDEYALLKEDIAKRGIISPIIKDAAGNIVDGYHRNKIAEDLGLTDIPIKQVDGTEAELQAMAIALNVARRQLDAEDRRELVTKLRAEGKSNRMIAETLGVSEATVRRDGTASNVAVDRVTGKDGKSRPARMTRKPRAKPEADPEPTNVVSVDFEAKHPVPVEEPKPATEAVAKEEDEATEEDVIAWDLLAFAKGVRQTAELDLTNITWTEELRDAAKAGAVAWNHIVAQAMPMSDLFAALWDSMSGAERLTVYQLVISDEWRSSRPRAIDRQPQQNRP
jgi:ParB-like chromosome segregation protein Spo0J